MAKRDNVSDGLASPRVSTAAPFCVEPKSNKYVPGGKVSNFGFFVLSRAKISLHFLIPHFELDPSDGFFLSSVQPAVLGHRVRRLKIYLTLSLAHFLLDILDGVPTPVYLFTDHRPRWYEYITHFNPTFIVWRYFVITDRRA
jgi:hypothetical protein